MQSEPALKLTQLVLLALFVVLAIAAVIRFPRRARVEGLKTNENSRHRWVGLGTEDNSGADAV